MFPCAPVRLRRTLIVIQPSVPSVLVPRGQPTVRVKGSTRPTVVNHNLLILAHMLKGRHERASPFRTGV